MKKIFQWELKENRGRRYVLEPGKVLLWRWELLLVTLRIFDIFKLSDKAIFSEWTEDINIFIGKDY